MSNKGNNKIRVVIADDHPLLLRGIKYSLSQKDNIEVVGEASDGKTALELIEALQPDIAVLDYDMPEYNGLEILRIVKKKNIPTDVIFLTMHQDPEVFKEAVALKAKGYMLKDSVEEEVTKAIEEVYKGGAFISPILSGQLIKEIETIKSKDENQGKLQSLTKTEMTVLKMVAANKTTREIADELFISPRTVDRHRSNICAKLNISGPNALMHFIIKNSELL